MADDELRALLTDSASETRRYIDAAAKASRADFEALGERFEVLGERFEVLGERLALVEGSAIEMRRHFDVTAEAMRTDVQTLGEGLGARVDGLERVMDEKFAGLKGEFEETRALIKLSYSKLDRRIEVLEGG